jgi:hypothetical protein
VVFSLVSVEVQANLLDFGVARLESLVAISTDLGHGNDACGMSGARKPMARRSTCSDVNNE